jgi:FkbM family methyltransferase
MAKNTKILDFNFERSKKNIREWLREGLLAHGGLALPAYRRLGWTGVYLTLCGWPLRSLVWPVRVPGYGELRSRAQALNFLGNFCGGELRNPEVENHLARTAKCRIIDVGVNLGMTATHWFALQPSAQVIGLDMMEEALSAATASLAISHPGVDWRPVCGVVTDKPGQVMLRYDDPHSGLNSVDAKAGRKTRTVKCNKLDAWLESEGFLGEPIDLIKVDVEGHGAEVLLGSARSLARTTYLVFEFHSPAELERCARCLYAASMDLIAVTGRNVWWRTSRQKPPAADYCTELDSVA